MAFVRKGLLTKEVREALFQHIRSNAKEKGIYLDRINGHVDHVHCLVALNADTTVAKTVQLLKGEAAFWANKQNLIQGKLEWADEYFAVSVSESGLDKVREYIDGQEQHHSRKSFDEEYNLFIQKYRF